MAARVQLFTRATSLGGVESLIEHRASVEGPASKTPANLLRYVLSNPGVSVAIPGARYPSRIHDNVALASDYTPMDAAEQRELEREAAALY